LTIPGSGGQLNVLKCWGDSMRVSRSIFGIVLAVAAGPAVVAAVLLAAALWVLVAAIGFSVAVAVVLYVVWHLGTYSGLPPFITRWKQEVRESEDVGLEARSRPRPSHDESPGAVPARSCVSRAAVTMPVEAR
jgi:hypothetical protein